MGMDNMTQVTLEQMYSAADPQRHCNVIIIMKCILHIFVILKPWGVKMHFFNSASLGTQDDPSGTVNHDWNFSAVTAAISDPHTMCQDSGVGS